MLDIIGVGEDIMAIHHTITDIVQRIVDTVITATGIAHIMAGITETIGEVLIGMGTTMAITMDSTTALITIQEQESKPTVEKTTTGKLPLLWVEDFQSKSLLRVDVHPPQHLEEEPSQHWSPKERAQLKLQGPVVLLDRVPV